ncbi:MAG: LysR family transcriptional regulator [Rhodospirillaceae bacterium]|nr:LysR family transcriptional regulator [Rhodospirillaceae bacterium]
MELHQIRYFLTPCRELNFTRAAEACHASQPALTKAIKTLSKPLPALADQLIAKRFVSQPNR